MTFEEKFIIMTSNEVSRLIEYVSSFDEFSENFVALMDSVHVTTLKRLAEHLDALQNL